jgi:hypothetical protein
MPDKFNIITTIINIIIFINSIKFEKKTYYLKKKT